VMRSRLTKVKAVAKTLHQHLTNLLTYSLSVRPYCRGTVGLVPWT